MELEELIKKVEVETTNLLESILKIIKCIQISKTFEDAVDNFKVFSVTLRKLLQKVEVCLTALFTRKQRNRTRICLSQISKCIPILLFTLQDHHECNPVDSKQYILKRLEICFSEMKNLLCNKSNLLADAEGEGCKFVHTMNAALQAILFIESHVHTESLDTSIRCVKMAVEDLLSHAMYIFQVSCHSRKNVFQATCTKVSRRLQELSNECLSERRNGTAINFAGVTLRAALEDLEHLVNKILLHLYLEVFSDPFDILWKIRQACGNSSVPTNYRKSIDLPVEAFDRHMECLLVLGQFAIASSENAKRVLEMSSCVASLESLETELGAALTTLYLQPKNSSYGCYVDQLMAHYKNEVVDLRKQMDTVVDPATFCSVVEVEIRRLVKVYKKASARPVTILKGIANEIVKKTEMLLTIVEVVMDLEEMQPISPKISSSLTSLLTLARKACRMCSTAVRKLCDVSVDVGKEKLLKRLKVLLTNVRRMTPVLEELMTEYHQSAFQEFERYDLVNEGVDYPNSIRELPVDMDTHNFSNTNELEKKCQSVLAVEDRVMVKPQMLFNRSRFHSSCSMVASTEEEEEMNQTVTFEFTEILEQLSSVPDTLTSDVDQASHSTAELHCDKDSERGDVEMPSPLEEDEYKPGGPFTVKRDNIENFRTYHSSNQSSKILKFIRKKYCRFRKMYHSKNSISKICRGDTGKRGVSKLSHKLLRAGRVAPMELRQVNGHLCSPSSPLGDEMCTATFWESREAHLNGVPFCESVMNCSIQEMNSPQTFKDLCCVSNVCSLESSRRQNNHAINKQSSDSCK